MLKYKTVPVTVVEIQPTAENSIGIDLGITNYAYLSNGKRVENPRFLRASAEKLTRLQAKLASRVKGSKPWKILKGKIAKLHKFVARARLEFQFKTAHKLFDKCHVWVVEDFSLNNWSKHALVKTDIEDGNLVYLIIWSAAKSGLNKSLLDAAHSQIANLIKYVAGKLGKSFVFLDPIELLNLAGIVSIKCLKNCPIDDILVSGVSFWIETKIQPSLSKRLD